MSAVEKVAKIVRTVTVPPVMVLLLLLVLWFHGGVLMLSAELIWGIVCLAIVPVLAYPLQALVPAWRSGGRDMQRRLAFVLSLVGYTTLVVYGLVAHAGLPFLFIAWTYFASVVVLTVFNKVIHVKASGHACSITGPLILLVHFLGWGAAVPCLALFAVILWSSVTLKRHTPREFAFGTLSCIIAFCIVSMVFAL